MPHHSILRALLALTCVALQVSFGAAPLALSLLVAIHDLDHVHSIEHVRDTGHLDVVLLHHDTTHTSETGDAEDSETNAYPSIDGVPAASDHVLHSIVESEISVRSVTPAWTMPPAIPIASIPIPDNVTRVALFPPNDVRVRLLDPLRTIVLRL